MKIKEALSIKKINNIFIISITLTLMVMLGFYYDINTDSNQVFLNYVKAHITESFLILIMGIATIQFLLRKLYRKLKSVRYEKEDKSYRIKYLFIFSGIIFVCWLPYLIICYPCSSAGWDYNWMLLQGTGVFPLSNSHPVTASFIYGILYEIGYFFNKAEGGLFFTGLFQVMLMSYSMGLALFTLRVMGLSKKIGYLLLVFICVNPVFASHAVWLIKDSIYASLIVILFTLTIYNYVNVNNMDYKNETVSGADRNAAFLKILYSPYHLLAVGFMATLYRSDAIIITGLFMIILSIKNMQKKDRKITLKYYSITGAFFVLFIAFKMLLLLINVPPTSINESNTVLSAQLVSCIKKHPEELKTADINDLRIIYKTDDLMNDIVAHFDYINRDPLKTSLNNNDDIKVFFKTWFRFGVKHPGTYIDTFMRGSEGYWWIFYSPEKVVRQFPLYAPEEDMASEQRKNQLIKFLNANTRYSFEYAGLSMEKTIGEYVVEKNEKMNGIFYIHSYFPKTRQLLVDLFNNINRIPLVQLFFVPGFYTFILLIAVGYLLNGKSKMGELCFPVIGILIINCLSPINGYFRYFIPISLCTVVILGLCFIDNQTIYDNKQDDF